MMKKLLILLLFVITNASSQTTIPVYISGNASDGIGSELLYELKQKIGRSASVSLTNDESKSVFTIRLLTGAIDDGQKGFETRTFYSVAYFINKGAKDYPRRVFLMDNIGWCGRERIATCSSRMAVELDELVESYTSINKSGKK